MKRIAIMLCLLGFLLSWFPDRLSAQGQQTPVDHTPFLDLLPGLRTAPAPQWVQPGSRLTCFSAAASIMAERTRLVEVPKGQGQWIDQTTGKEYQE